MSSGKGSYNLNTAEYGDSLKTSLSVLTLVINILLSSPKFKNVFKSKISFTLYPIVTLLNKLFGVFFSPLVKFTLSEN